jgi:hypothetical protein
MKNLENKIQKIETVFSESFDIEDVHAGIDEEQKHLDSKNDKLSARVESEQNEISEKIRNLAKYFNNLDKLAELQVELFSLRQICVEKKAFFESLYTKLNRKNKEKKRDVFLTLKIKGDSNVAPKTSEEFRILSENLMKDIEYKLDVFSIQKNFYHNSIDTLDRMIFGVKNRIQIYDIYLVERGQK